MRMKMLVACAAVAFLVAGVRAADLNGTWALEFQRNGSDVLYQADCSFKQEGDRLSGSCISGFESLVPVTGNTRDTSVTFQFPTGVESGTTATFTGQLDAKETLIKGTWRFVDERGNKGEGTFSAMKR